MAALELGIRSARPAKPTALRHGLRRQLRRPGNQLAEIIEEGIRYPGFAFINVQSPCVTYGLEEQQLKAHKTNLQNLEAMGHDTGDRARATELAREYGKKLYTALMSVTGSSLPKKEVLHRRNTSAVKDGSWRINSITSSTSRSGCWNSPINRIINVGVGGR